MPMDRKTGKRIGDGDHVDQCIENILQTQKGSRVMEPDYGADLIAMVDEPLNEEGRAFIAAQSLIPVKEFETRPTYERVRVFIEDEQRAQTEGETFVELTYQFDSETRVTVVKLFEQDDPNTPVSDFLLPKDLPADL